MNKKKSQLKGDVLRELAEEVLAGKDEKIAKFPIHDIKKLIHELQVYQIELEMQNEELRRAQTEIEKSRSKYVNLYDFAPNGYVTLTKTGKIVEANLTLCSLLGTERKILINSYFSEFIKSGLKTKFYTYLSLVFSTDTKQTCVFELVKKDSSSFYISMESAAMQVDEDRLCLSAIVDITGHKRVEDELRISENKYRILLENLPQKIFYKNKHLVYISCNENFAKDLQIKPEEVRGKTDYDFYSHEIATKYRIDDMQVITSGKTGEMDDRYIKNDQEFIIHIVRTPVRDEKGHVVGILGIFWDITEKLALEREAERARHLAALGEMAAGVGHEINNPITGVINCAQILFNKSPEGSREKDIATRIIKDSNRIASITSKLLSFVKIGNGKERKEMVSMYEALDDVYVLSKAQLQKEGIKLKIDIPKDLPGVLADRQLIQQVFLNIINNSRYALDQKYPGHHEDKILEISGREVTVDRHPFVEIIFCDHGIGISDSIKDKVLNPFFTTKPLNKGTGLGLSVSYNIVSKHGGKLIVESSEGKYTKISVLLPVCAI